MDNKYSDELWLGTLGNGEVRWVAVGMTNTVEEAANRHHTTPVATAALGRLMGASLLLASSMKAEEAITLRLLGDGPLGGVVAVGNPQGEARGYVQEPQVELPLNSKGKLNVSGAVGAGEFVVSHSLANGESYTGMVPLVSGEIADDLVHYLLNSEQVRSAALLGVMVGKDSHVAGAAGMLFQLLPDASEESVQALEAQLAQIQGISQIAADSTTMEELVRELMGDLDYRVLEKRPVQYKCTCSKERVSETLISIGKEGFEELLEDKQAELVCHFCNEHYHFDEGELRELYEQVK
ncbi:MAG TPA: Hsp33 family molecular chaperone HslO [Desulfitobacterium dehalogenans]|uniref:33 kDa chaperonin n=1 Tax=Desulfitobacterium dehalogenans TaxID=36854 RepID=A0A7C7D7Q5_9FIRM|nr:Hsp33 family molecular chaperone HslO [Desulfitobacterium dehalogenans]